MTAGAMIRHRSGPGRGQEMTNLKRQVCGNFHADAPTQKAYIQCWPFEATLCSCGDVGVNWGVVKSLAFDILIGWWWDGMVRVAE
jgi:hypothetical protein